MPASALSVLPSASSLDLGEFVNRHNRLPRVGDALAPWHLRGWLLAYVILIHERCPSVADRWGYHLRTLETGCLLDELIPQIAFGPPDNRVASQLHAWSAIIGHDCGGWSDFRTLLDWLLYREVTGVRGKVSAFWRSLTVPFPEPGIRLIRQHEVQGFNEQMAGFRTELETAVGKLDDHYSELKSTAQRRLGDLFDANDYPPSLRGLFSVEWDFPNVEPPDYLLQLNPSIYDQERARVSARFEEAVQLAEQAFISEFAKLIEHLTERLSGGGSERKIFRDSAITNLTEFFERFRQLNVRSNADLDAMVERAQQIISGVEAQSLRDNNTLRQHVATQFSQVQSVIDGMLVDRPRRRIIRNTQED